MREILVRGKRVDNGEWVYGSLIELGKKKYICFADECHNIMDVGALSFEVIPETVGQYIGFLDKNGNKIFKSDIVLVDGKRCIVVFENGCYYPMGAYIARSGFEYDKNDYEIIGNIHDNSKLLKEV